MTLRVRVPKYSCLPPGHRHCVCHQWMDVGLLGCTSSIPVSYVGLKASSLGVVNHCMAELMCPLALLGAEASAPS